MLLAKIKRNTIEVFISKALIDWCINHDEFVSANNVLRQYNQVKTGIKNPENDVESILCQLKAYTENKNTSVRRTKQNTLISLLNCAIKVH